MSVATSVAVSPLDTTYPLKFLRAGRALDSVMSKQPTLMQKFRERFGQRFQTVGEYYAAEGPRVELVGIGDMLTPDVVAVFENDDL